MRVTVVRPGELGAADLRRWTHLASSSGTIDSPFLSPEFSVAVGEQRPAARVAVMEGHTSPVGFFSYEHHRGIARPIGSGLSDYQAVIAAPGAGFDLPELLRSCRLWGWDFDHLAGTQQSVLAGSPHRATPTKSPVMDLREGFEPYAEEVRGRSRSLLQNTARKRRRLEREVGAVDFEPHSTDHSVLDLALRWKSDQYRRTGRRDRFARAGNRRLVHRLLDTSLPAFGGGLAVLRAAGAPVAALFYLRSSTLVSYWFPAYDPDYQEHSPGIALLVDLARSLGESQRFLLDLGKGDERYKERFHSWSYPLLEGHADRSAVVAAARTAWRAPRERMVRMVLSSEPLRESARTALGWVGSVRQATHRRVHPPG